MPRWPIGGMNERNVKLGTGGMKSFLVQTIQVLAGKSFRRCSAGTLEVVEERVRREETVVSEGRDALLSAYLFLQDVEL